MAKCFKENLKIMFNSNSKVILWESNIILKNFICFICNESDHLCNRKLCSCEQYVKKFSKALKVFTISYKWKICSICFFNHIVSSCTHTIITEVGAMNHSCERTLFKIKENLGPFIQWFLSESLNTAKHYYSNLVNNESP